MRIVNNLTTGITFTEAEDPSRTIESSSSDPSRAIKSSSSDPSRTIESSSSDPSRTFESSTIPINDDIVEETSEGNSCSNLFSCLPS